MSVDTRVAARIAAGETLGRHEVEDLAAMHDVLALGMLADDTRRRVRGTHVTYVRVANCPVDRSFREAVPAGAKEVRLTGAPVSVAAAVDAVVAARAVAGDRTVSGFSLAVLQSLAGDGGLLAVLRDLRAAGLDLVSEIPLDRLESPEAAVEALMHAGFTAARLTVDRAPAEARVNLLLRARALRDRYPVVVAINPLPLQLQAFRPTTGFEDTRLVALARLVTGIPVVQVDWLRYGPKLAQVALIFGADDLDNVSDLDEAPDGARRGAVAEVRRNIEAAGFVPEERGGDVRVP